MSIPATDELLGLLAELRQAQPTLRLGQLVASLVLVSRGDEVGAVWEVEDDELAVAAKWQLEQLGVPLEAVVESVAAADRGRNGSSDR